MLFTFRSHPITAIPTLARCPLKSFLIIFAENFISFLIACLVLMLWHAGKATWGIVGNQRNGNTFQYSCLENSMGRGPWWATVHGVAKSQTRLSNEHNSIIKVKNLYSSSQQEFWVLIIQIVITILHFNRVTLFVDYP